MMDDGMFRLTDSVETRWLTPENPTGARGGGGKTNFGRKGAPCRGQLAAGETWVLGEGEGTGTIRRMWITVSDWSPDVLRGVVLRMYWDGAKKAAVEAPLADFFCSHHGRHPAFANTWFNNPEGRNWNCTIPMPFRKSFRITVSNESARDVRMFWYHIDYTLGDAHDGNSGYFHAYWNRENPTTLRRDFKILPKVSGRGRFLGCSLGLITRPYYRTWWGEGEVKIYLDGDTEHPTLCGTGTEDYICSAWGIGTFSLPWYGCHFHPVADTDRAQISMYRLHGPDPVHFQKEIRVELQQIGYWGGEGSIRQLEATGHLGIVPAGDGETFIPTAKLVAEPKTPVSLFEREDDWCATAYFYLDRPETDLPAIAPLAERIADLTGDPTAADFLVARVGRALAALPLADKLVVPGAGQPVEERLKRVNGWTAGIEELRRATADAEREIAERPDAPSSLRLRGLLDEAAKKGVLSARYGAAVRKLAADVRRDPASPIVVTAFRASGLLPKAADIRKVSPPKPGMLKRSVPFVVESELADIRGIHGNVDGLVYVEGSVKLAAKVNGALWYGADGPVKVWVNGRNVDCRPDAMNPAKVGEYRVSVTWKKGMNRIVFAVDTNQGKAWGVVARVMRKA